MGRLHTGILVQSDSFMLSLYRLPNSRRGGIQRSATTDHLRGRSRPPCRGTVAAEAKPVQMHRMPAPPPLSSRLGTGSWHNWGPGIPGSYPRPGNTPVSCITHPQTKRGASLWVPWGGSCGAAASQNRPQSRTQTGLAPLPVAFHFAVTDLSRDRPSAGQMLRHAT